MPLDIDIQDLEQLLGALRPTFAAHAHQEILDRQIALDDRVAGPLGTEIGDSLMDVSTRACRYFTATYRGCVEKSIFPEDIDMARDLALAGEDTQERRLARAVGTDQQAAVAMADLEVNIGQNGRATVVKVELLHVDS